MTDRHADLNFRRDGAPPPLPRHERGTDAAPKRRLALAQEWQYS